MQRYSSAKRSVEIGKNFDGGKKKFGSARMGGEEDGFPLVRGCRWACCADDGKRTGVTGRKPRHETSGCGSGGGAEFGASGALLSELFSGIGGEPVQVEMSGVRVLFELLGFLLGRLFFRPSDMLGDLRLQCAGSKFFLVMARRERCNAMQAQCGRVD
jgi:hypothetical protein